MNKRILILVAIGALICGGCTPTDNSSGDNISTTTTTSIFSTSVDETPGRIDFYAINDFHGHIQEDADEYEPGLARIQTYLQQQKAANPDGFVFLSSGDTFQETYDSSINQGEIVAKALPLMEAETMTLGNHEFDWGLDIIKRNKEYAGTTTFLGANIYEYDEETGEVGDFASDLADEYKIIERDGVTIGIIGIIGQDQITSITSNIWEGLTFLEPTEIVQNLSDKLKGELGCDIVIVSAHASFSNLGYTFANAVTSVSPVTNQRYIDACFTAHSHGFDNTQINGVQFLQSGSKGLYVSHIALQVDDDGSCTLIDAATESVSMSLEQDSTIQAFIDSYLDEEFYEEKNAIIGYVTGATYMSTSVSGKLLNLATYYELEKNNIEVDVVMNNGGRNSVRLFDDGGISIGKIYDALPFLNLTYVTEVLGSDILNEAKYNPYYAPNEITIVSDQYYTIAVIDYLLLHKNSSRAYDYFPSYSGTYSYLCEKVSYEIVRDYFIDNGSIALSTLNNDPGFDNITNA